MECQDCNKKEAEWIVNEDKTNGWFFVCEDCIKEDDIVVPFSIQRIIELHPER